MNGALGHTLVLLAFLLALRSSEPSAQPVGAEIQGSLSATYSLRQRENFEIATKSLTREQRQSVSMARDTLLDFFKSTQMPDRALARHLSKKMASTYPTRDALMSELFDDDVEAVSLSVVGFKFLGTGELQLRYYLVLFADGNFHLKEDVAYVAKEGLGWRLTALGTLAKPRQ